MQGFWSFLYGLTKAIMAGLVYYAGREQGRRAQKIETNEKVHENLEKVNKAIAGLTDDERKRLQDKYHYK